jgi:hypothetical protein
VCQLGAQSWSPPNGLSALPLDTKGKDEHKNIEHLQYVMNNTDTHFQYRIDQYVVNVAIIYSIMTCIIVCEYI